MLLNSLKTYRLIKSALESSWWPPERIRQLQENRLRKLLFHAYRNVSLYRKLYDELGFRPKEFNSLDDLKKIPILQKERLKDARPEELIAQGVDLSQCGPSRQAGQQERLSESTSALPSSSGSAPSRGGFCLNTGSGGRTERWRSE